MIDGIVAFGSLYAVIALFVWAFLVDIFENPLYRGLLVMFWPIALALAIPCLPIFLIVNWIKSCIEYYREKRNGKN